MRAAVSKALAGKRVVVVDDTAIIRLDVEDTLREAGATITRSFENGADAAVLDVGAGSLSIAQALAERKIPFLFYTGLPFDALTEIRERWQGCKVISKPARREVIVAAVADEEYASIGADAVARHWQADEAVIPEPTDLDIGIAHKGFSCAEVAVSKLRLAVWEKIFRKA